MGAIVTAVIVVAVIGVICAVMLSVASKVMAVQVDERIPLVRECLPGANCGGCGFPGCDGYAAAMVNDEDTPLTLCAPGGAATAEKVANVLGRSAGEMVKSYAYVNCLGDCDATGKKLDYVGIETCAAAKLTFGGEGKCTFGCIGLGDCTRACPSDAIHIGAKGIARVDTRVCTGCSACAKVCPNHIISILPAEVPVRISCSSHDKGPAVKAKCSAGCLGCGMCMRKCPSQAIHMENNLAVIDYEKCTGCGTCAAVCPAKCILPRPEAKQASA
ncbi:MAG: RnfABCDGE type electron transport complex subunit B [Oscillospiraceae bacterium]|nr:RnfABCDGE type electron transport complex subunit B [Oscillospiraceae bacterium]